MDDEHFKKMIKGLEKLHLEDNDILLIATKDPECIRRMWENFVQKAYYTGLRSEGKVIVPIAYDKDSSHIEAISSWDNEHLIQIRDIIDNILKSRGD